MTQGEDKMTQGNPYAIIELEVVQELHRSLSKQLAKVTPTRGLLHLATALWQRRPQMELERTRAYNKRAYDLGEC